MRLSEKKLSEKENKTNKVFKNVYRNETKLGATDLLNFFQFLLVPSVADPIKPFTTVFSALEY
jgi:hypothetical protein